MSDGDGGTMVLPNKLDYLAALKSNFRGNPEFDQTVVEEYIAMIEKRTARELNTE